MWSHGLVHTATITGLVHSLIAEAVGTRTTHVQYLPDGGAVLLFDSPLAALSVALEIYRAVQEFNADMTDQVEWHIRLAGIAVIHMADNYVIGPALFGPAVQIAANVSWAAVTGTLGGRVDVSAPAVWTEPAKTKANVHSSRSTDSGASVERRRALFVRDSDRASADARVDGVRPSASAMPEDAPSAKRPTVAALPSSPSVGGCAWTEEEQPMARRRTQTRKSGKGKRNGKAGAGSQGKR